MNGSFCNFCALAVWLALHIFAKQCWLAQRRAKQLSAVAILLYRFLSCWCLETFSRSISLAVYCLYQFSASFMTQTFSDAKLFVCLFVFFGGGTVHLKHASFRANSRIKISEEPQRCLPRDKRWRFAYQRATTSIEYSGVVLQTQVNINLLFSLVNCLWLVLVSCRRGFLKSEEISAKFPWRDQPKNTKEQVYFYWL